MGLDIKTLAAAKKYTKESLNGAEAIQGKDGKSAYQIAVDNGFVGTQTEWLESLKGEKGDSDDCNFDKLFNSSYEVLQQLIPEANNTYDLGSTIKSFRTGYFSTLFSTNSKSDYEATYDLWIGKGIDGISAKYTSGYTGFSVGNGLVGSMNNAILGHYNSSVANGGLEGTNGKAFVIGNGTGYGMNSSNAFIVNYDGTVMGCKAYTTIGSDYAEYLEWKDKNTINEDRVGKLVTLVEDKIAFANAGDFIIGIVSGNPSIIGNSDFDQWSKRYQYDDFNRLILGDIEIIDDESGEVKILNDQPQINPKYDTTLTYSPRKLRPEWDTVGMLGVLRVYDDGTCVPGGWCKAHKDGLVTTAVAEDNSFLTPVFYVMKRVSDNIIEIFFK